MKLPKLNNSSKLYSNLLKNISQSPSKNKTHYFSLKKLNTKVKKIKKWNIKEKSNIYKEIELHNYKLKYEEFKKKKYKNMKFIKNLTKKFSKYKKSNENSLELNPIKNENLSGFNKEVVNRILVNKLKKFFDEILSKTKYKSFEKSIRYIENYINEDNNFFDEIKKSIQINFLNFKKKFLLNLEKNSLIKDMVNCFQKLNFYIDTHILSNFKFNSCKDNINYIDIKSIFLQVLDLYNDKMKNNNDDDQDDESQNKNHIKIELQNLNLKKKKLIMYYDKIKSLKEKKSALKDKININYSKFNVIMDNNTFENENNFFKSEIHPKVNVSINPNHIEIDNSVAIKKFTNDNSPIAQKKRKKDKISKLDSYNQELTKIIDEIKFNKLNHEEVKLEIKLDQFNLKKKIVFKIYNDKYQDYGLIFYLKSLKILNEKIDLAEISYKNPYISNDFLTKINNFMDYLINFNNTKDSLTYENKLNLKKKFGQILGFNYSKKIKLNELKKKLIKNFVFENNAKNLSFSKKHIKYDNENFWNSLNNLFINEIRRLNWLSLKYKNGMDFLILLSNYFGINNSKEIVFKFKKIKNIQNSNLFNFTFFNQFLSQEIN